MHFKLAFIATLVTLAIAIPAPHIRPSLTPAPPSLPLPEPISSPQGLPPPDLFLRGRRDLSGVASSPLTALGRGVAGSANSTVHSTALLGARSPQGGDLAAHIAQGGGVAVANLANLAPVVQKTVQRVQHNHGALGDVARIIGGRSVSYTCTSGVSLMCCNVDSAGNLGEACTLPIPGEACVAPSQAHLCCDSDDPSFDFQCIAPTPLTDVE